MHLTLDILRLKAARYMVLALWLHLPLVLALAQLTHTDPMAPAVTVLVLACLATCVVLRRSLAPLGAVLVALAFGGIVSVLVGLLQATPWQAVAPVYVAAALAMTLPLCSGAAVLAFAGLALLPDFALQGLDLAGFDALPSGHATALLALLTIEAAVLAALAQTLARVLQTAQATATAARREAESLWQSRTSAQMLQAQFIAALVDRITAIAQNPVSPAPTPTVIPFAYAEVEMAIDLLAQKLRQGGGLKDISGFAGFDQIDLAAATTQLAGCLHDQSTRLTAIFDAAQGDCRAKVMHQMRLDLADLAEQTCQAAAFAADLSHAADGYNKTPLLAHPHLSGLPFGAQPAPPTIFKQGLHQARAA
jgi:hypothetical protein